MDAELATLEEKNSPGRAAVPAAAGRKPGAAPTTGRAAGRQEAACGEKSTEHAIGSETLLKQIPE